MIDKSMKEELLPSRLIVKGLIRGQKLYNYENYIIEFLNHSKFFNKKCGGKPFVHSDNENNGQCDCYSGEYGIDFKLFISNSLAHALAELRPQFYFIKNNAMIIETASRKNGSMGIAILHKILRNCSNETLEYIHEDGEHTDLYVQEIKMFKRILLTPKNLLFFFPYSFSFDNNYEFDKAIDLIRNALQEDMIPAFNYRQKIVGCYETYLAFIYCDNFVITHFTNNKMSIVDCVKTSTSNTYQEIKSLGF